MNRPYAFFSGVYWQWLRGVWVLKPNSEFAIQNYLVSLRSEKNNI